MQLASRRTDVSSISPILQGASAFGDHDCTSARTQFGQGLILSARIMKGIYMGAWGPALFSDDIASDVRSDYRALIEDGAEDDAATQRVLDSYTDALNDSDDGPVVWLALAFTQSKIGRLDPAVAARALQIIDNGEGMSRWHEQGARAAASRESALAKVRAQLAGPQPPRRRLSPPWRHVTALGPGDVLAFQSHDRPYLLLRVARLEDSRYGVAPVLILLDFAGPKLPGIAKVARLRDKAEPPRSYAALSQPWGITRYHVGVYKKSDPDYLQAGFSLIGTIQGRDGDQTVRAGSYTTWKLFGPDLESQLERQPL
jgi:hypothetical protein